MTSSLAFYIERAEAAAEDARLTNLPNVRERALRAEASWRGMITRARQLEENRARRDSQKGAPGDVGAIEMATDPTMPDRIDPQAPPETPPAPSVPDQPHPDEIVPVAPDFDQPDQAPQEVPGQR